MADEAKTTALKELGQLIRENYAARERGEIPDEWFWADRVALELGYALNDEGELEPILRTAKG